MRIGRAPVAALLAMLAACMGSPTMTPAVSDGAATPELGKGVWRSFAISGYLEGLVRARNGDFWAAAYAYPSIHSLSRITPAGKVTTHSIGVYPQEMALDSSGNFWLTTGRNEAEVVEVDPRFHLKSFPLSSDATGGVIVGGDGNVWFTESLAVGKITPDGKLTEYTTPEIGGESGVAWTAHRLFFFLTSGLASIDSKSGALSTYDTPYDANQGALVAASDGAIWFFGHAQERQFLVRFDPASSKSSAYKLPAAFAVPWTPGNLIQTPDGAFWIGAQHIVGHKIRHQQGAGLVRFDSQSQTFIAYKAPRAYGWPWNLAAGPGGSIWATAAEAVYELKPTDGARQSTAPLR